MKLIDKILILLCIISLFILIKNKKIENFGFFEIMETAKKAADEGAKLQEGYTIYQGTDAGGNDITHLENSTFSECKKACDDRTDCKGFNFPKSIAINDGKGTCWIKNNVSNRSSNDYWSIYENQSRYVKPVDFMAIINNMQAEVEKLQVEGAKLQEGYSSFVSTDAAGNDITHLDNSTFSECKKACDDRTDCKGFNFPSSITINGGKGTCWIKNNVSNRSSNNDWGLYENKSRKIRIDLIDPSDDNPMIKAIKDMKTGIEKLGDLPKIAEEKFKSALNKVKDAFEKVGKAVEDILYYSCYRSSAQCWKNGNDWVGNTDENQVPYKCTAGDIWIREANGAYPLAVDYKDDSYCKKKYPAQCGNGGCWMKSR